MVDIPLNTYIEWTDADREHGECPVPDGSDVTVWFRDGTTDRDCEPESWCWGGWTETSIAAYLVHSIPREPVLLWFVVEGSLDFRSAFVDRKNAENWAKEYGGRVVKLVEVDDD